MVAAIQERFARVKYWAGFPSLTIQFFKRSCNPKQLNSKEILLFQHLLRGLKTKFTKFDCINFIKSEQYSSIY